MAYPCSGVHTLEFEILASKTPDELADRVAGWPREALGQGTDGPDAVASAHATAKELAAKFCAARSCPEGYRCLCTDITYYKELIYEGPGAMGATLILEIKTIHCKCRPPD